MDTDIQRTIDELIARYELEPDLRDLYVEGPNDRQFFDWFFRKLGCESVSIFEIGYVDISANLINKLGLRNGNRDRVVALSLELEKHLLKDSLFLTCVADSDFDFLLGRKYNSCYLLYTDYTSLDTYLCSEQILDKFLTLGIRQRKCEAKALFKNFVEILQEVFLIHAVNEKLEWGLKKYDFTRCCKMGKNQVYFDSKMFLNRYLSKNNRLRDIDKFIPIYEQLKKTEVESLRHRIRGKDFLNLLAWYASKKVNKDKNKYKDQERIRGMISLSADPLSLSQEVLFAELLKKYGD